MWTKRISLLVSLKTVCR